MKKILSVLLMLGVILGVVGFAIADDQNVDGDVPIATECSISPLTVHYGSVIPGATSDPQKTTVTLGGANNVNVDLMIELAAGSHELFKNIWYDLDANPDFEKQLDETSLMKRIVDTDNPVDLMSVLMVPMGTKPVKNAMGTVRYTCAPAPECSDGIDNMDSEDEVADVDDPGCMSGENHAYNPMDTDETDPVPLPQCSDGLDNDNDTFTDFPNDQGCIDALDNDESA